MNNQYRRMKQYFGNYIVAGAMVASVITLGSSTTRVDAAGCVTPLGTDAVSNSKLIDATYQQWKDKYVTSSGAGGDLRVQRSSFDNYDTVSEGIAYGMLFAVYNSDKSTFDGLWAYAQKHVNSNGVMNWKIAADGSTTGFNGATDADEDIAAALVAADTSWGGYRASAVKQIETVKRYQIEQDTFVVKPGDVWGGSNLLNPSYLAPSYYDVFQNYTGDNDWAKVKIASYHVLQAAQNQTTGLVPDWSTSTGAAITGMSHEYSYDASRAPLRIALASAWSCDTLASDLLKPFNEWFAAKDLSKLASSYTLDGTANGNGDAIPVLAAATSAASVSKSDVYRSSSWKALSDAPSTSYYPDSMKLFSLLVASGTMVNPLNLPQRQSVATIAPATLQITGADSTTNTGKMTELSVGVAAPKQQDNLIIDVELYDKTGRKVAQQVYENQTISTGVKTYNVSWTPDSTGEYTLKAGVFTAGWAQNLKWNDRVATVTVSPPLSTVSIPVSPTPTPLPVASPVATSSPTPMPAPSPTPPVTAQQSNLSIWWPGSTQAVSGTQPFKAVVDGKNVDDYDMFWQVDGGRLNEMDSIHDNSPHKESWVGVGDWNWSATNRYTINFVAKNKNGTTTAQKSTVITIAQ